MHLRGVGAVGWNCLGPRKTPGILLNNDNTMHALITFLFNYFFTYQVIFSDSLIDRVAFSMHNLKALFEK